MALRDLRAFLDDDDLDYPLSPPEYSAGADGKSKFPEAKACRAASCEVDGRHCHYKVPSPDAKTGLYFTALADLGATAATGSDLRSEDLETLSLNDDQERSLYKQALGPVYDEMVADGVKWTSLKRFALDAYLTFAMGAEVADAALQSLGKAQPNRQQRRAAKKTAGRKSSRASTGSATQTPPPASTGSSTSAAEPGAAAAS